MQLSGQAVAAVAGPSLVGHINAIANPGPNPTPNPNPTPIGPLADLGVVSINVQSLGNNQFEVTATLENVPPPLILKANLINGGGGLSTPGVTYPGGGVFFITRTDGGTSISQQLDANGKPTGTVLDTPDPDQIIASMPIPSIAPGQTVQLSTTTTGRAIFTGNIGPVNINGHNLPFPETNPGNDFKTVDTLIPHTKTIDTTFLGQNPLLEIAAQNAQFTLDANNSHILIPGIFNTPLTFKIPAQTVSLGLGLSATYTVNDLVSTSTALSYEQGGLAITVNFANNPDALVTTSFLAPNISVTNLQVKVLLPLSYDANGQYLNFTNPKVTVTGNWSATGFLGPVFNLLLPDINAKIESKLASAIQPELGLVSFPLNEALRAFTAGGRIVSADIQQNQLILSYETPT